MSLKQRTLSAGRWTAASTLLRTGLQLAQTAVLARLLAPADFGLMAVASALFAVINLFADLGLSRAIVRHDHIPTAAMSTLFWLNALTGLCLTGLVLGSAHWLAELYHEPELAQLLIAASPVFVITALGQQFCVLAEKELRFATLAKNETAAALLGFVAAIGIGLNGGGVMALVAGFLVTASVGTALAWTSLARGHLPTMHFRLAEARPYIRYGGYLLAENLVGTLVRQADVFVGGWMFRPSALGQYSLPRDLSLRIGMTVNPILTRVAFPVFARLQHDRAALQSFYLQTLRMTASVNFPIYTALGLFSEEIVSLIYGRGWTEAAHYLRIFALWGLLRSVGNPTGSLLYAIGHARSALAWNVTQLAIFPAVLYVSGRVGGLTGLAWGMLLLQCLIVVPMWRYLVYPACGVTLVEYAANLAPPLLAGLIAGSIAVLSTLSLEIGAWRLLVGCAFGAAAYLGASTIFNRQWLRTLGDAIAPFARTPGKP